MRKTIISIGAMGLSALPSVAGDFTVKFEVDGEHIATWTYDDNGTATNSSGEAVQYVYDAETETFTATSPKGEPLVVTLIGLERVEGHEMEFKSGDGIVGTAIITSVNEN